MGTACCNPKQVTNDDLRHKTSKKKGDRALQSNDNPFKNDATGPDFIVERRDSLGMAAKEHTSQIMAKDTIPVPDEMRKSLQSDVNTNGVASSQNQNNGHVFTEGTFQAETEIGRIQEIESSNMYSVLEPAQQQQDPKHSFGGVSFGAANNKFLQDSSDDHPVSEKAEIQSHRGAFSSSVISIRDIQEVRDKQPASPATANKQDMKESHFQ